MHYHWTAPTEAILAKVDKAKDWLRALLYFVLPTLLGGVGALGERLD